MMTATDVLADEALREGVPIEIVRAEHLSDYKLKLCFSNGAERIVNFEPFLRNSRHP